MKLLIVIALCFAVALAQHHCDHNNMCHCPHGQSSDCVSNMCHCTDSVTSGSTGGCPNHCVDFSCTHGHGHCDHATDTCVCGH